MTTWEYLSKRGFTTRNVDQPVGASDYVGHAGIFRVRVRVPIGKYDTKPDLWVGFTAGGPLVERRTSVRYVDPNKALEDAAFLLRLFRSAT